MCNRIFELDEAVAKAIPEEGFGWKGFYEVQPGEYQSLVDHVSYDKNEFGIIEWDKDSEDAFCFFLDKEEAERAIFAWRDLAKNRKWYPDWYKIVIKKIKYYKGIQTRKEPRFIIGEEFQIALCQEFEIVEE